MRASLDQSHDVGHTGRFGRYIQGFSWPSIGRSALGPLQFPLLFFPEDPHNTFLNSFMVGGWLGGVAYLTLVLVSVVFGGAFLTVATPWRPTYQAVYVAYVGTVAESVIIDIDHWRHYYLLLGVLWGLMAASRPYLAVAPPGGIGARAAVAR